jgi:hypothetical protein
MVVGAILLLLGYLAFPYAAHRSLAGMGTPEHLVLYSIDGRDFEPGQEPQTAEKFHKYPVLGKIEIQSEADREVIMRAMKRSVAGGTIGQFKNCFWPRHGIRANVNGETFEFVICFECDRMHIEGAIEASEPISDAAQPVLNKYLTKAGIPIAPSTYDESE